MTRWQVQEAKARLSELLEKAQSEGPQVITRHGVERAVVIDIEDYAQLVSARSSLVNYLLSGPRFNGLEIERSRELGRDLNLQP